MKKNQMTRNLIFALAAVVFLGMGSSSVFAGGHCPYKGSWGKSEMTMEQKFDKKMYFIDAHEEELGLTEDQKNSLEGIKVNLQKSLIELDAKVDVLKIDINSQLHERLVNVEGVNALIDQKYEAKKTRSKTLVKAYADLKSVLTDAQYEKMKELWKEKKSEKRVCKKCDKKD